MDTDIAIPAPSNFADIANGMLATAMNHAAILARCTVHPWVVSVTFRLAGQVKFEMHIVRAPMAEPPAPEVLLPADAELLSADVFVADRFEDMAPATRQRYTNQYRRFLMWRRAWALRKSIAELEPWVDYDPVVIDAAVARWARPGCNGLGG